MYIEVGQPASQERSLADIWSALGGELKPSLDLVVTAPIVGRLQRLHRAAGPGGAVDRDLVDRGRQRVARPGPGGAAGRAIELDTSTTELLPANAGAKDGGVRIRVSGVRRPPRR